jgi:hypothetical protein
MGSNVFLIHAIVESTSSGSISTANIRRVEIETTSVSYIENKKINTIVIPQSSQKQASGPRDVRILDLLRVLPYYDVQGNLTDFTKTTLNGTINASATSIVVTDGTTLDNASTSKPSYIKIDEELIKYTGKSSNTITGCVRGCLGTTAASHTSGVDVIHPAWHYAEMIRYLIEAGGTFIMVRGTSTDASIFTLANSFDLLGNAYKCKSEATLQALVPNALVKVVNTDRIKIDEVAEDSIIPEVMKIQVSLTPGVNLT